MIGLVGNPLRENLPFLFRELLFSQLLENGLLRFSRILPGFREILGGFLCLVVARDQLLQFGIPVVLRQDRKDIPLELRKLRRSRHRIAEILVNSGVALLVFSVFRDRSSDAQHSDHKGHLRHFQILSDVPDKVGEHLAVGIVSARFIAVGINASVNHIVPALEPDKAGQLMTIRCL